MSIVTVAQFKAYNRKSDGDTPVEALYQMYIDAAETIVKDRLGYDPAQTTYTQQIHYGDGKPYLQLKAKPITALSAVVVDSVSKAVVDFDYSDGEWLKETYGNPFPIGSVVKVTYQAGYATVPALIQETILRITGLFSMESGENIGATSVTFDGSNRTFVNYTNFDRYLEPIEAYRIRRLPRLAP
jgi:N-methylhydantoinase B/oxoprolinase/acetone carboxylase alpha subunit